MTAEHLLASLRSRGIAVVADGDRLRCRPGSALTPSDLEALAERKGELLDHLLARHQTVEGLSLSDFERGANALELRVPWFDQTLWFVPRSEHVETLLHEGVARGRIWTAVELRELSSLPGITPAEIANIGRLRAAFDAEIVEVGEDRPGQLDATSCRACRGTRLWRSIYGRVVCAGCHPPGSPSLVAEWIDGGGVADPSDE